MRGALIRDSGDKYRRRGKKKKLVLSMSEKKHK